MDQSLDHSHEDEPIIDDGFVEQYNELGGIEMLKPPISEEELREVCEGNEVLEPLFEKVLDTTSRYARDVWSMEQNKISGTYDSEAGAELLAEEDDARTRLHTALMDDINIFSRALNTEGENNSWMRELVNGPGFDPMRDRASYGLFAIKLTYSRALSALENNEDEV